MDRPGRTPYRYKSCGRVAGTPFNMSVFVTPGMSGYTPGYYFRLERRDSYEQHGGHLLATPAEAERAGRETAIRIAKTTGEYRSEFVIICRYLAGLLIKVEWSLDGLWSIQQINQKSTIRVCAAIFQVGSGGNDDLVLWSFILGRLMLRLAWVGLHHPDNWWGRAGKTEKKSKVGVGK